MSREPPPLIVLDTDRLEDLDVTTTELSAAGWLVRDGVDDVPLRVERLVCRAVVTDARGAESAVLAASWGAGLLLGIGAVPDAVRDQLLDDLGRIGSVSRRPRLPARDLHPEAAAILDLLADGHTLGHAAAAAFVSRRTADRRLAEARRQLGAGSTAEAIRRWRLRQRRPPFD